MTSAAEILLAEQLRQAQVHFVREYKFLHPRRFRADFMVPLMSGNARDNGHLLIEVEGGTWVGGRHVQGAGFESGCEKQALAVLAGYRYLRVTSKQVENGTALGWIQQALGLKEAA